jgi:hypothetical protein
MALSWHLSIQDLPDLVFKIYQNSHEILFKPIKLTSAINSPQEDQLFEGSSNPFLFEEYLDLVLRCNFEFSNYPFDLQVCPIEVN